MRQVARLSWLTALPFMLVFAAQDVRIATCIESDGTGLRQIVVVADRERSKTIDTGIRHLLPSTPLLHEKRVFSGEKYRVVSDSRFTDPGVLGDVEVTREVQFGGWPPIRTVYIYTDTIRREAYEGMEKEQEAAPKTEFQYSLTLPGMIEPASLTPVGGKVQGSTVTWKLKADKETLDLAASSSEPAWMPITFAAYVLLVLIVFSLRSVLSWRRNRPRRI